MLACSSFGLGFLFTLPVVDGVAVPGRGRSSSGIAVLFGYPWVGFGGTGVSCGVVWVPGARFFVGLRSRSVEWPTFGFALSTGSFGCPWRYV